MTHVSNIWRVCEHRLNPKHQTLNRCAGAAAESSGKGYLAQHPLFDQIPELRADLEEPEYCVLGQGELQSVNAWFGPPGTVRVTGLQPAWHPPHPIAASRRRCVECQRP